MLAEVLAVLSAEFSTAAVPVGPLRGRRAPAGRRRPGDPAARQEAGQGDAGAPPDQPPLASRRGRGRCARRGAAVAPGRSAIHVVHTGNSASQVLDIALPTLYAACECSASLLSASMAVSVSAYHSLGFQRRHRTARGGGLRRRLPDREPRQDRDRRRARAGRPRRPGGAAPPRRTEGLARWRGRAAGPPGSRWWPWAARPPPTPS